jgi:hypothetical protein
LIKKKKKRNLEIPGVHIGRTTGVKTQKRKVCRAEIKEGNEKS